MRRNRAREFDKHFTEAERCSAFFLRRPRPHRSMIIPGVKRQDGSTSINQSDISNAHKRYWSDIYSASSGGAESPPSTNNILTLTGTSLPKLPTHMAMKLEEEITEEDIVAQISRLPNNKAAGADGIRAELLKANPKLWARVLKPVFEKLTQEEQQLPRPLCESIIILIYKKGCPLDPCNYRPISLLSVLAKLLSGIHNARLRTTLTTIVPPEQTGFIPHRSISRNITLLQDAIFYAKRHHPSAIILSLDFQKAYDRVQWTVLKAILTELGFGPRWMSIVTAMYSERSARLSINGELSMPFELQRGVLQGDPLSPALFILHCMPLYSKLNAARQRHGIPLPHGPPAPVATFYADDTNLIAKCPNSAVCLYRIAEWFCKNSSAKQHPAKCIAIPTGPAPPTLPNGITIMNPSEHTTLLGVPMGMNVTRHQQTGNVIAKMIQRCNGWAHVGRTIEGKVTVARAMLLSTIWYVLGVLPTDKKEAKKIQRVINNYIQGAATMEWNGPTTRANLNNAWLFRQKDNGGWGLKPILHTLRVRKLSMIRSFLKDRARNIVKPWHAFITHMLEDHMYSWGKSWKDILWWQGDDQQMQNTVGNWSAVSPWWKEAWQEWLRLKCRPRALSIPRNHLKKWPVWNNRILKAQHGIPNTLHLSFSNTDTRSIMGIIRKLGFTAFEDFMHSNGTIMSEEEFYTTVTVHLSVINAEEIVPRWACGRLIRIIAALWANTTRKWLLSSSNTPNIHMTTWWHTECKDTSYELTNNKQLSRMVSSTDPPPPSVRLINLHSSPTSICWKRERTALKVLAPSRRDLLLRLIRNALPLGAKRIHWDTNVQTACMLCDSNTVETAEHLFWECPYAKEVWNQLPAPWRNHSRSTITWAEILKGYETRINGSCNKTTDQLWAIIRGCTIRVIWFERNRRYFYENATHRSPTFRHNQGLDDIKAHIESWCRRADDKEKDNLKHAISFLAGKAVYQSFLSGNMFNQHNLVYMPTPTV